MAKRTSIEPTYDSRETGPRYRLSTFVGRRTLDFDKPLDDPFVSTRITIGWPDLLRGLLRRRLVVRVQVSADRDLGDDVLELDANYLGTNSTRRDEFNAVLGASLETFAAGPDAQCGDDDG